MPTKCPQQHKRASRPLDSALLFYLICHLSVYPYFSLQPFSDIESVCNTAVSFSIWNFKKLVPLCAHLSKFYHMMHFKLIVLLKPKWIAGVTSLSSPFLRNECRILLSATEIMIFWLRFNLVFLHKLCVKCFAGYLVGADCLIIIVAQGFFFCCFFCFTTQGKTASNKHTFVYVDLKWN